MVSNVFGILVVSGLSLFLISTLWTLTLVWRASRPLGFLCLALCPMFGYIVTPFFAVTLSQMDWSELSGDEVTPPAVMWLTGIGMLIIPSVIGEWVGA